MVVDEGMDNGMADLGISITQSWRGGRGIFFPPRGCCGYEKAHFLLRAA